MTEPRLYNGVKKRDLPRYDAKIMGGHYLFKIDEMAYPEHMRAYVIYASWTNMFDNEVRYYISDEAYKRMQARRRGNWLEKFGDGYIFRRTPVPCGGGWKNSIWPERAKGAMAEHNHNLMCKNELEREYGKLVRMKRAQINELHATDYDYPYCRGNRTRGWKRSKKRKQWM
ncbi:hypothetical protein VPHF86_0081 [Vibrio phage F86]